MLKSSQITALALTLASLLVGISTEIAYAKQSTGHTVVTVEDSGDPSDGKCTPRPKQKCPVIDPKGDIPSPQRPSLTSTTDHKLNQQLETVPAATP